jgi:hypothetical protein
MCHNIVRNLQTSTVYISFEKAPIRSKQESSLLYKSVVFCKPTNRYVFTEWLSPKGTHTHKILVLRQEISVVSET